jgi:hypothetical protein
MGTLSYDVVSEMVSGKPHTVARGVCAACGAVEHVTMGTVHNPEFVQRKFREKGWDFEMKTARLCRCPACVKSKSRNDVDSALRKVIPMATVKEEAAPRQATPAEKKRIRDLLDGFFDEQKGCYLEGYSDQRIGKELDLPWAMVVAVREAAYGPIRTDPELDAVRARCADLEKKLAGLMREVSETQSAIAETKNKVDAIERRLTGVAA